MGLSFLPHFDSRGGSRITSKSSLGSGAVVLGALWVVIRTLHNGALLVFALHDSSPLGEMSFRREGSPEKETTDAFS